MKKIIIILTAIIAISSTVLFAQPLPPTGNAGQQPPMGGAAPLDGGISILLLLSAVYGGKKAYLMRKSEL